MIIRCWNHKYSIIVEGSFHLPYDLISFLNFNPHQQYLLAKYLVCTVFDDLARTIVPQRFNSGSRSCECGVWFSRDRELFVCFLLPSPVQSIYCLSLLSMQTRRAPASPLAVFLSHPPVSRRTSSLLSVSTQGSPRTPRSCGSPSNSIFVPPPPNRKSTDSWNSSNADDLEWEWKPEQILLLSRVSKRVLSLSCLLS